MEYLNNAGYTKASNKYKNNQTKQNKQKYNKIQ